MSPGQIEARLGAFIFSPWTLRVVGTEETHHTMPLCIDFLPGRLDIEIGPQPVTCALPSFSQHIFLSPLKRIDGFHVHSNLKELGGLLMAIHKGFRSEQLWSGDWFCQWTEPALTSVNRAALLLEKSLVGPQ